MDTVTQMLLGATVAQAGFHRRFGRRALAVGAAVALVPDLDVVAGWIGSPYATWLHHRGLTHSLVTGPLFGLLFGWLAWAWHRRRHDGASRWVAGDARRAWIWLALLAFMTHPIIDVFTTYGTQWLYPLTDARFALRAMPIIDPIYSLALVIAVGVGVAVRRRETLVQNSAAAALFFISVYTLGAWAINDRIETIARSQIGKPAAVAAYPTLFQPLLRRVVVETEDALLVGFHSILSNGAIEWERFPLVRSPAIDVVAATREAQILRWFASGQVYWRATPLPDGATLVQALDTRYGMPGAMPLAFWGIQATVGEGGTVSGAVEIFRFPRNASAEAWQDLGRRIMGWRK